MHSRHLICLLVVRIVMQFRNHGASVNLKALALDINESLSIIYPVKHGSGFVNHLQQISVSDPLSTSVMYLVTPT